MSWDDDIYDMTEHIEKKCTKAGIKKWDEVICPKINQMEAMIEAADNEISRCNANITANNNLFNYLIDSGMVSREDIMRAKLVANPPGWYKSYVVHKDND